MGNCILRPHSGDRVTVNVDDAGNPSFALHLGNLELGKPKDVTKRVARLYKIGEKEIKSRGISTAGLVTPPQSPTKKRIVFNGFELAQVRDPA